LFLGDEVILGITLHFKIKTKLAYLFYVIPKIAQNEEFIKQAISPINLLLVDLTGMM
jgi:hypothetical protein